MTDTTTEVVDQLAFDVVADAANMNNGFPFRGEMAARAQNLGRVAVTLATERDTLAAEAERVRADAYERGMQDALGIIASLGYGRTEDVDEGHEQAYRAIESALKDWKAASIRAQGDNQ